MATWQYDLRVVPNEALERELGASPIRVPENVLEQGLWSAYSTATVEALGERLFDAEANSWHSEFRSWGHEEGTRLDLWTESGGIDSVRVRIDARSVNAAQMVHLCEWARDVNVVFVDAAGRVVRPDPKTVFRGLAESKAGQFVRDPERFLAELASEGDA